MQMEKLTIKAQEALKEAQEIARGNSNQEVDSEHLLLALLEQPDSLVPSLVQKMGVAPINLTAAVQQDIDRTVKLQGSSSSDLYSSSSLKKALDAAESEAGNLRDEYISTEHL